MNYNDDDLAHDTILVDVGTITAHLSSTKEHIESVRYLSYMHLALHSEWDQSHGHLTSTKTPESITTSTCSTGDSLRKSNVGQQRGLEGLPLSLSCRELMRQLDDSSAAPDTSSSMKDSSLKQLRRDLIRDKLILNGERLSNAELDLEGICEKLASTIIDVVRIAQLPSIEKSVTHELAVEILRKASRTNSGYVSYQLLQHFMNMSGVASDITPLSNRAKPIGVNISIGTVERTTEANRQPPEHWGLLVTIHCSSFFQLTPVNIDDPTIATEPFVLEGIYEHHLVLPFDVCRKFSATNLNALIGKSAEDGVVTLRRPVDKH